MRSALISSRRRYETEIRVTVTEAVFIVIYCLAAFTAGWTLGCALASVL